MEMPCPKCGHLSPFRLRPETSHYGEIRCWLHGHAWIPKPDTERKPKRKANRKLLELIPSSKQCFCWSCLRSKDALAALRPSLQIEVHHVIEVVNGGSDSADNLQVLCTECHAEIHRRRESFRRYETETTPANPEELDR